MKRALKSDTKDDAVPAKISRIRAPKCTLAKQLQKDTDRDISVLSGAVKNNAEAKQMYPRKSFGIAAPATSQSRLQSSASTSGHRTKKAAATPAKNTPVNGSSSSAVQVRRREESPTFADMLLLLKRLEKTEGINKELKQMLAISENKRLQLERKEQALVEDMRCMSTEKDLQNVKINRLKNMNEKLNGELTQQKRTITLLERKPQEQQSLGPLKRENHRIPIYVDLGCNSEMTMEDLSQLESEAKKFNSTNDEFSKKVKKLQEEKEQLRCLKQTLESRNSDLAKQMSELQTKLDTCETEISNMRKLCRQLEEEKSGLHAKAMDMEMTFRCKELEVNTFKNEVDQTRSQMTQMKFQMDKKNQEMDRINTKLEYLNLENNCLQKRLAEANGIIESLQEKSAQAENLKNRLTRMQEGITDKDTQLENLRNQFEICRLPLEEEKKHLTKEKQCVSKLAEALRLKIGVFKLQTLQVSWTCNNLPSSASSVSSEMAGTSKSATASSETLLLEESQPSEKEKERRTTVISVFKGISKKKDAFTQTVDARFILDCCKETQEKKKKQDEVKFNQSFLNKPKQPPSSDKSQEKIERLKNALLRKNREMVKLEEQYKKVMNDYEALLKRKTASGEGTTENDLTMKTKTKTKMVREEEVCPKVRLVALQNRHHKLIKFNQILKTQMERDLNESKRKYDRLNVEYTSLMIKYKDMEADNVYLKAKLFKLEAKSYKAKS